jgi:putative spermidine/putrescine transport system permease protein
VRPRPRVGTWILGLAVYAFLLAPLAVVAAASLDASQSLFVNFPPRSLGLRWYREIPARYVSALAVSASAAGAASAVAAVLGVAAALGLVRGRVRWAEPIRAFFRAPLQIPFVVTGVVFLQFYYALYALTGVGLAATFPGLVLAYVLIGTPYTVGTVGAVLERINPRLDEAAAVLGATRWSTLRRVTLPLIAPGIYAGMLYAFIVAFGDVPISIFLSSPQYMTLPVEIFQTLQFDFNPSVLAISTLIVALSMVALWLIQRLVGIDAALRG